MRHPSTRWNADPRRAFVLLAVLVVIVLLSLAAYQFSDLMSSEYRVADSYARSVQARALADSGIHYAAVMLSNPTAFSSNLNGQPYYNTQAFQGIQVNRTDSSSALRGRFSILAPLDVNDPSAGSQTFRFGVTDEGGKININAVMKIDPTGNTLNAMLLKLPNMTPDIADAICDWLDADDNPRPNGAEETYYATLSPPYHCKNGPLDSLEELLLVKGVTPLLLFGNDRNRNGALDPGEDAEGLGTLDRGWSAYLTVYSRELNVDSTGNPRIYLNSKDLQSLQQDLSNALNNDALVSFILAYRLYGASTTAATPGGAGGVGAGKGGSGGTSPAGGAGARGAGGGGTPSGGAGGGGGGGGAGGSGRGGAGVTGAGAGGGGLSPVNATGPINRRSLNLKSGKSNSIASVFSLVNASVRVPSTNGGPDQIFKSPLSDPGTLQQYLPILLDKTTTKNATELPPRINVNTAPLAVLEALSALPKFSEMDVQSIFNVRPTPTDGTAPDASFQSLAWLITQANMSPDKLASLDSYITASSQVYRVQSLGFLDKGGPTARVEAVIDTNLGYPRILYRRDLSELGKGYDLSAVGGSSPGSRTPGG